MRRTMRWLAGGLGFLLPCFWLGATALLYAWFPGFRGSGAAFCLILILALILTGAAGLTAPTGWRGRILRLAVLETLLLTQVAFILGWAYFSMGVGTRQPRIKATADWMKLLESAWGTQSPGKDYSIRSVPEPRGSGETCLRFELRKGEHYSDLFGKTSFRSEVNARDFPPMGSVRWYAFSLLVPEDFPIEDNRLVLAQWHGADKKYLGELSRSPSMAFRYANGSLSITICHSADRIVRDAKAVLSKSLFQTEQFPRNTWNDFVIQARWSCQSDGFVNVWWNGLQVVRYSGPVGYNDDFGPYFKFGLYRDDSDKSYAVYFNRVRLGGRREDVDFYHYASRGVAAHRRRSLLCLCSHSDDLWRHQNLPEILNPSEELLQMTIPAHGVQLYKLAAAHK